MPLLSDTQRARLVLPVVSMCVAALAGCADARGRFEDFQNRLSDAGAGATGTDGEASDGGPCTPPAPGIVSGPALLAVDTNLAAGHPILFLGEIDTPDFDDTTAVHFVYRALDSLDRRTLVGKQLEVGPFPLYDGVLVAEVPESELDGDANPQVHGAPITSAMTLTGHICGAHPFYCGIVEGRSTGLVTGPFTGTFGITLLGSADAIPDRPRYGCRADDLAEPLQD